MENTFPHLMFYSPYRDYPFITVKEHKAIKTHFIQSALNAQFNEFLTVDGHPVGLVAVVPLQWESNYFSMPMARVVVYGGALASKDALSVLLEDIIGRYRASAGCQHFSIEVDVDDYSTLNLCTSLGFEIIDFKRTYFTHRLYKETSEEKRASCIRAYQHEDKEQVLNLFVNSEFSTRFTRDKFLDANRSRKMYLQWAENLLASYPHTSNVLVAERKSRIIACGAIGEKDLRAIGGGRVIRSGSIYASKREGVGMYGPILRRLTQEAIASHGVVDTTVSLNLSAATRVVEGVRPNRSVTHACLRLYLD